MKNSRSVKIWFGITLFLLFLAFLKVVLQWVEFLGGM